MTIAGTQQICTFKSELPKTINDHYLLYLPKDYDFQQSKRWPLIFFLHGAGERGHNLDLVKTQGLPKKLQSQPDLPFIVVSPQCSLDTSWSTDTLNIALDEILNEYTIDTDRLYVTGLSMGGFGTWHLAMAYPHRFAAIVPICGGGDPDTVCDIKHLPIWVFHGAKDTIVPLTYSEAMVETLKKCGGNVRFTIYPYADHDSWTETYANPELYTWLLERSRKNASG
ncbi:MAG: hypothetical protein NVS4B7_06090 [Ktedonobacteraceae bacterium]